MINQKILSSKEKLFLERIKNIYLQHLSKRIFPRDETEEDKIYNLTSIDGKKILKKICMGIVNSKELKEKLISLLTLEGYSTKDYFKGCLSISFGENYNILIAYNRKGVEILNQFIELNSVSFEIMYAESVKYEIEVSHNVFSTQIISKEMKDLLVLKINKFYVIENFSLQDLVEIYHTIYGITKRWFLNQFSLNNIFLQKETNTFLIFGIDKKQAIMEEIVHLSLANFLYKGKLYKYRDKEIDLAEYELLIGGNTNEQREN